jgi:hypothetical protein
MRGRKPKQQSRSEEFRKALIAWKQTPVAIRASLRALARELGTSHQLLGHYLSALEEWRWEKELQVFHAKAKAKNLTVTPAVERRYLDWLRKIEGRQVRDAARAAKWASKQAALLDSLKYLLPDSWSDSTR